MFAVLIAKPIQLVLFQIRTDGNAAIRHTPNKSQHIRPALRGRFDRGLNNKKSWLLLKALGALYGFLIYVSVGNETRTKPSFLRVSCFLASNPVH